MEGGWKKCLCTIVYRWVSCRVGTSYCFHQKSFTTKKYANNTALSNYVWQIKNTHNKLPDLKWSIIKSVPAYSNLTKRCLLCLHEKLAIISYPAPDELLNKKTEFISKCRHENKFLLANYKSKD